MAKAETALLEEDYEEAEILEQGSSEDQDLEGQDDDQSDDDQVNDTQDDEENEIFLDGDEGSHPQDEQRGIRKRINKLNEKVVAARKGADEASEELEIERERNRLLQMALEDQGKKPAGGPPDPNDFDDGVIDPGFIAAYQEHIANGVSAQLQKQGETTRTKAKADEDLKGRQVAHYQRADTLKVRDYDEVEDKAIAVLGQDVVNQMIGASDKSPELLYYLGKNTAVAEELSALIKSNPVKGVLRIGELQAGLKTRPKADSRRAPDPDGELAGGGAGKARTQRGPKGAKFE